MANDKSKSLLTLVRLSAVLVYGYSVYYFETNVTTPIVRPYGKFKYLTYLDLVCLALLLSCSILFTFVLMTADTIGIFHAGQSYQCSQFEIKVFN